MNKMIRTLLFLIAFSPALRAQTSWKKSYTSGTGEKISISDIKSLPNGGFVIAGEVATNSSGNNAVLMRCDADGHALWAKYYDSGLDERAYKVSLFPGGGYVLAINQLDTSNLTDNNFVIRTDTSGGIIWTYGFTGNGVFVLNDIEVTPGGTTILAGNSASCPTMFGCGFNGALDASGNVIWMKTLEAGFVTSFNDVLYTSSGDLLFTGSNLDMTVIEHGMAALYDSTGNVIWSNSYLGGSSDRLVKATENNDAQGYVMVGSSLNGPTADFQALLIATNYAGQYQAGGYSGGPEGDEATEIITVAGTNLLMAGYSEIDTALNIVSQGLNLVIDISTGATFGDILIGNGIDQEITASLDLDNQGFLLSATQRNVFDPLNREDFITKRTVATGTVCDESPAGTSAPTIVTYTDAAGGDTAALTVSTATAIFFSLPLSIAENLYCGTTGINETENSTPISFYPNPASSVIQINNTHSNVAVLSIFNLNGAIVSREQINPGIQEISLEELPQGCYVMQLQTNDGVQYGKVVKVNP
jgi:Secretion system C-terminal sorting domain